MRRVMTFLGGSHLFGLNREGSDQDFTVVYLDFHARLALDNKPKQFTFVEGSETPVETTYTELGVFLKELEDGNLKYAELVRSMPRVEDEQVYAAIKEFIEEDSRVTYPSMYQREIRRRMNKLFFSELNPAAKNFNKSVSFDTKFAAHLYRVIQSALSYATFGVVPISYSEKFKEKYFKIRDGFIPQEECFSMLQEEAARFSRIVDEIEHPQRFKTSAQQTYLKVIRAVGVS